ncbi:ArnT family glycosyltransferase [Neolewinella xylanilytica]|uniref:ArnT family glycosyltransferase n=1 Tax=Neolewinella xylanilytica TaxID=1514080 RepID=UPI0011B03CEF|nr:glycosyltransferase family 39 protein [Neolewinella xylanilytica]
MIRRTTTVLFFVAYFLTGLWILDDYGVSMDEALQRDHGRVMLTYWADLLELEAPRLDRLYRAMPAYGMFFPATSLLTEMVLGLDDSQFTYFRLRHVLQFLLFFLAVIAFHRLLRYRWSTKQWYPLLGAVMLVLSPRIFAHAFFDPKDVVMLSLYTVTTYTLVRFLKLRTWGSVLLHAVATGILLGSRQASILIPMATVVLVLYETLTTPQLRRKTGQLLIYLVVALPIGVLWNPHIYMDQGDGLLRSVTNVADYHWDGMVLFMGETLNPGTIPWYYLPTWIGLTTPVVYLLFIAVGLVVAVAGLWQSFRTLRLYDSPAKRADLLLMGLTFAPLLAALVLQARLYQGWRHLFFIYPGLIYLAVVGLDRAFAWKPKISGVVLGAGMAVTLITMVRMHPHQQVYFNQLVWNGPNLLDQYELDFWGVSYRRAFVMIGRDIPEGEYRTVKCHGWACMTNLRALPPETRNKFREVEHWHEADYFATEFYYPTHREQVLAREDIFARPIVEMAPGGHTIIGVYPAKLK